MSKICKNCGAMMSDDVRFCGECGKPVEMPAASVSDEPEIVEPAPEAVDVDVIAPPRQNFEGVGADARDVRERLVGTKTEYYLPKFETMETLNSFTSWNWAAFFLGVYWMLYRKMYVFGFGLWILSDLFSMLGLGALNTVLWIGVGVLGNFLYMKDINNRTEKAMNLQPEEREAYIQKNSGTGWVGILAAMAISVVLAMFTA